LRHGADSNGAPAPILVERPPAGTGERRHGPGRTAGFSEARFSDADPGPHSKRCSGA
jgi:hypothetical protein